jgi:hypothetical protein
MTKRMVDELDTSPVLGSLIFLAIDHAMYSVEDGEVLIPFLIMESGAKRRITRYTADEAGRGVEEVNAAKLDALHLPNDAEAYVIAYDGFVTIAGQRTDCIYVEGGDRGAEGGHKFAQRYEPGSRNKKARKIGDPVYLGSTDNLLTEQPGGGRAQEAAALESAIACRIEKSETEFDA